MSDVQPENGLLLADYLRGIYSRLRSCMEPPVATLSRGLFNQYGQIVLDANAVTNGAVANNGGTVTVVERGGIAGGVRQTTFTLVNLPLTLADATTGAGTKIYDFPEGVINILSAAGSITETTTSVLASTLNTGVTYNWGVGTVTQSNGTLATTEQDILPTTDGTASATINVAGAASSGARVLTGAYFDGTGTAKDAFLNIGVAGATDIDGDATVLINGTITIWWQLFGDK